LRRCEAFGGIIALAQENARIELAARGIGNETVFQPVRSIAGRDGGAVDQRIFVGRNMSRGIFEERMRDP